MAHDALPLSSEDIRDIVTAPPFEVNKNLRILLWCLVALAVGAIVLGFLEGEGRRVWVALQVNFNYWFFVSAAASCFAAAFHICNAQWSLPIRRVMESAIPFFTACGAFLLVLAFGRQELFKWAVTDITGYGKAWWLSPALVYGRNIAAIALLVLLARRLIFYSLQRDIGAIRGGLTTVPKEQLSRWFDSSYDRFVAGWGADGKSEILKVSDRMSVLSPIVVIVYALVLSLVAWDQVMSVDPYWYSTMFGGFLFMAAVYSAVAWTGIGVFFARHFHPLFRAQVRRSTLHDLGKLMLGFGIFWAYLFWSQYLPYWYSNIPEFTQYLIIRLREEPWHSFAWAVLGASFIIPFLLGLSKDMKQVPGLLALVAAIIVTGQWMMHYLLFAPAIWPKEIPLGALEVAISFGFLGVFVLSCLSFLVRVPLIPFGHLFALRPRPNDLA